MVRMLPNFGSLQRLIVAPGIHDKKLVLKKTYSDVFVATDDGRAKYSQNERTFFLGPEDFFHEHNTALRVINTSISSD